MRPPGSPSRGTRHTGRSDTLPSQHLLPTAMTSEGRNEAILRSSDRSVNRFAYAGTEQRHGVGEAATPLGCGARDSSGNGAAGLLWDPLRRLGVPRQAFSEEPVLLRSGQQLPGRCRRPKRHRPSRSCSRTRTCSTRVCASTVAPTTARITRTTLAGTGHHRTAAPCRSRHRTSAHDSRARRCTMARRDGCRRQESRCCSTRRRSGRAPTDRTE